MSFIKNIEISDKDLAIVETIINFAHRFNLKTIAEGVETENQVKILQKLGCDYLQGFYFAKPMPFNELQNFLKSQKSS
jgi:EAL domain-containing protein (putative c-di-GMP-specific phosphodiesterase class I)